MRSTIPDEIVQLSLPAIHDVIVMGGSAMELIGLRKGNDIDLVISLENWRYLRDNLGWEVKEKQAFRRYLSDPAGRFDVWRWWFNPDDGSRTKIESLKQLSYQHEKGFYYLRPDAQITFKQQLHRDKDAIDIQLLQNEA